MHRAFQQSVIALAALLASRSALAFHAGSDFDKAPGAGGGGGLFCTGALAERGFTCASCHTDAPNKITVSLDDASNSLFTNFRYTASATYPLTATLNGDTTTIAHFNGLSVSVVDDAGKPIGIISGFAADEFYQASDGTIASAGKTPGVTRWTFSWTAPPTGSGAAHLHVASVAGNAAGLPGLTLTDPFGDDVFVGTLDLDPDVTTGSREVSSPVWAALACVVMRRRKNGGPR